MGWKTAEPYAQSNGHSMRTCDPYRYLARRVGIPDISALKLPQTRRLQSWTLQADRRLMEIGADHLPPAYIHTRQRCLGETWNRFRVVQQASRRRNVAASCFDVSCLCLLVRRQALKASYDFCLLRTRLRSLLRHPTPPTW